MPSPLLLLELWLPLVAWQALASQALPVWAVPGLLGLLPLPIWLLLMVRLVLELVQEPLPGLALALLVLAVCLEALQVALVAC
jgi:hypothetical protein